MSDILRYYEWDRLVGGNFEFTMHADAVGDLNRLRWHILDKAGPLPDWPPNMTFRAEGTSPQDVPSNSFGWVLFSERLKALVQGAGLSGMAFYPVQVHSELPVSIPRYWYAHCHPVRGAIDMRRSVYKYLNLEGYPDEHPLMMVKFVLKADVIREWDVFRTAESSSSVFCSQRFRDIFVENGCTGLGFDEVPVSSD